MRGGATSRRGAKGDRALVIDPSEAAHVATIAYDRRGRIQSSNSEFNRELDEVLNLNDETRDPPGRPLRPFAGFLCAWIVRTIRKFAPT